MKTLLLTFLALFLFTKAEAIGTDKYAHFGLSFAMTSTAYAACAAMTEDAKNACLIGAAGGALLMGAAKEIADDDNNTVPEHFRDLSADVLGIGLSVLTIRIAF